MGPEISEIHFLNTKKGFESADELKIKAKFVD